MVMINIGKTAGEISPLWFGHNLEHTRSSVWNGLSAQLIRNRKFAGRPERDGLAKHWNRIGPPECWHALDFRTGEAYTSHFDSQLNLYTAEARARAERQRQKIQAFGKGNPCGIGQRGIFLVAGKEYEIRLALQSDRKLPVRIRLCGQDHMKSYFEENVTVRPQDWREYRFAFVAVETEEDARIEIVFSKTGTLHVGAVSLLPIDHFNGMRRDVIHLLKAISVPILRWPGGNFAGDYRWKDGLLPVDRRSPLRSFLYRTLPRTDGYDNHEIGTDEFIALCKELGAEPFITINMSLEGPEEAAAWVEYCNGSPNTEWGMLRVERGHPEPYKVRYWALGNEMGYGHMKGPNRARDYAQMAAACASAMKKVDSSIVLTACGTFGFRASVEEYWDETVVSASGRHFDNISFHRYTVDVSSYLGDEGRREFRRIAGDSSKILQSLKEARALYNEHAPAKKIIGLSFDEWNVANTWNRAPGVLEAIYTASMLNMFCNDARKVGMSFGTYFQPVNGGAILVEPKSSRLTPSGQVFSLFKLHQGNQLIEIKPQTKTADLDLAASVNKEKREVTITLLNRSPDKLVKAKIVLENVRTVKKVEGVLLSAAHFLPGSEFRQDPMKIDTRERNAFSFSLPRHSVARILIDYS